MEPINTLTQIDYAYVFVSVFAILVGIKAVVSIIEWIIDKLGLETKGMRKRREEHELLIQTAKNVNDLSKSVTSLMEKHKQDMDGIYNDNVKYRGQSQAIKDNIMSIVENISDKIDAMQTQTNKRFLENEEKENNRVQAEIKDKIAQSYRHYNSVKQISDMELEALEGLIETYESYGGENSFIHSIVQKEMYTWEVT